MLSGKNVLSTSVAGFMSVLLAGTVSVAIPQESVAKSHQKKHSTDKLAIAALDSLSAGTSQDSQSNNTEETDSKKVKLAKKEKESKSKESAKESSKDSEKKAEGSAEEKKKVEDKAAEKKAKASESDKAATNSEKKGGGSIFSFGGSSKKTKSKTPEQAKKENAVDSAAAKAAKPVKEEEDPTKPKYKFDPALISVLKDINKSLKDSEAVSKLEDPIQKLVAKLAGEALDKALTAPDLHANRIVDAKDKARMESSMSAEAWDSGVVDVSPDLKASVVALWAKKAEGLLTVQIVGEYNGKIEGSERKLGEFIAVITAQSAVDKGFDIQSQQDVNFWIGKVTDLKIDCYSGKEATQSSSTDLKSFLMLSSPITARKREFFAAVKEWDEKRTLAKKAEEEKKKQEELQATLQAKQNDVAEALAQKVAAALIKSANAKAESGETSTASAGGNADEKKSDGSPEGAGKSDSKTETASTNEAVKSLSNLNQKELSAAQEKAKLEAAKAAQDTAKLAQKPAQASSARTPELPTPVSGNGASNAGSDSLATIFPDSRNSRSSWDSPSAPSSERTPSSAANLFYPARAVAGQYMTVAVLNNQNQAEQFVGLSFNGAQISTGDNGKVVFQIPEDAPPGYSMHLSLMGRSDESPAAIEVLQPLAVPSSPQIPNLESVSPVVGGNSMITIGGHNFDGIAERNRVIIDGSYDANVIVSSPVQLKAQLPAGIPAGQHSVCVSTAGLRSNPGNFDLVTVDLAPQGPDTPKNDLRKLAVKVQGTQNKVRVKLVNQSRDVIKMLKGDEVVVITSGGAANQVIVPVQRLRWGNYKIDAEILI